MTTWYSSCVTSYLPIAKGYLIVTLWAGRSLSSPPLAVPMTKLASPSGTSQRNSSAQRLRIASVRGVGSAYFFLSPPPCKAQQHSSTIGKLNTAAIFMAISRGG